MLYADTLDPMLSYNALKWLFVLHNITDQLPGHIGRISMTQRTKNREKLRYVGPKTRKIEVSETEFDFFLKLPEVRWTPE